MAAQLGENVGESGGYRIRFEAQYTRFGNLAKADYLPERME